MISRRSTSAASRAPSAVRAPRFRRASRAPARSTPAPPPPTPSRRSPRPVSTRWAVRSSPPMPAARPTAACARSTPRAPRRHLRAVQLRAVQRLPGRRSSATTSSPRRTMKSATTSRSTPAGCSRRTRSRRSSLRRARSAARLTINLNNPFLPATLRNQFCAFNIAPNVTGVSPTGASVSGQIAYTPRFTPAECAAAASRDRCRAIRTTARSTRRTAQPPHDRSRPAHQRLPHDDVRLPRRRARRRSPTRSTGTSAVPTANPRTFQSIQNYTLQSRFRQGVAGQRHCCQPGLRGHLERLRSGQHLRS